MNQKALFLRTLEDLNQKSQSGDWYDMLLISGLIYKLLYDTHPLVDENNPTKAKIFFEVNSKEPPKDPFLAFWSIEDGFDPETSVPHLAKPIKVDRQGLYARQVMIINSETINIKDLIRFLRNKQGGVHNDNISLTDKDKILKELQGRFGIMGVPAGLRLMRAISRVVAKGLIFLR
jgi:hypothetical protein